eukprot:scaffold13833_cov108-Phaeocystis_antarctica.AAC.2
MHTRCARFKQPHVPGSLQRRPKACFTFAHDVPFGANALAATPHRSGDTREPLFVVGIWHPPPENRPRCIVPEVASSHMNGNAEDAGVVCSTSEPWRRHITKPTQDPSKCLDGPRALHANPVVLRFNAREHAAFFFADPAPCKVDKNRSYINRSRVVADPIA